MTITLAMVRLSTNNLCVHTLTVFTFLSLGTMHYKHGDRYEGLWSAGDVYTGQLHDNKRHSYTTTVLNNDNQWTSLTSTSEMCCFNGDKYIGHWDKGEKCGQGL